LAIPWATPAWDRHARARWVRRDPTDRGEGQGGWASRRRRTVKHLHSIPSAGNDLVLVAVLAVTGLALGVVSGLATHVRAGGDGVAIARVGWLAGSLLIAGISSRMVFAFAVDHGAQGTIRDFSVAHQIGAAAWPVALVAMAVLEVTARVVIVHVRGLRSVGSVPSAGTAAAAAA
jgi:hypothetical protein